MFSNLRSLVGTDFGDYHLTAVIGEGGMAVVFRGESVVNRSIVRAIKVIRPEYAAVPEFVARFSAEAGVLYRLKHPNIVDFHGVRRASHGTGTLLAMELEFLEGSALDTLLKQSVGRSLPVDTALEITLQASRGVAHAHILGVVHRDLKPGNIFVLRDGRVKVLDFGIAKAFDDADRSTGMTRTGTVPGTPAYMAPEVCNGGLPDVAADVYALGVTLLEMLLGYHPYNPPGQPRKSSTQMMLAQIAHPLPAVGSRRPDIPSKVGETVERATDKQVALRYRTALELASALERALADVTGAQPLQHVLDGPLGGGTDSALAGGPLGLRSLHPEPGSGRPAIQGPAGGTPVDDMTDDGESVVSMTPPATERVADPVSTVAPGPRLLERPSRPLDRRAPAPRFRMQRPQSQGAARERGVSASPEGPIQHMLKGLATDGSLRGFVEETPLPTSTSISRLGSGPAVSALPGGTGGRFKFTNSTLSRTGDTGTSSPHVSAGRPAWWASPRSVLIGMGTMSALVVLAAVLSRGSTTTPIVPAVEAGLAVPPVAAPTIAPGVVLNRWVRIEVPRDPIRLGIDSERAPETVSGFRPSLNVMSPEHDYQILQHEVTWAEYSPWANSQRPAVSTPADALVRPTMPAVGVEWDAAYRYCRSLGGSLPSERQWEFAARGVERRPHPWGSAEIDVARTHVFAGTNAAFALVMSSDQDRTVGSPSAQIFDLAGNAREWTIDLYRLDRRGDESWVQANGMSFRAIRGLPAQIAFNGSLPTTSATVRDAACATGPCPPAATIAIRDVGFRCVKGSE